MDRSFLKPGTARAQVHENSLLFEAICVLCTKAIGRNVALKSGTPGCSQACCLTLGGSERVQPGQGVSLGRWGGVVTAKCLVGLGFSLHSDTKICLPLCGPPLLPFPLNKFLCSQKRPRPQ